jgi:hypothetical protein
MATGSSRTEAQRLLRRRLSDVYRTLLADEAALADAREDHQQQAT